MLDGPLGARWKPGAVRKFRGERDVVEDGSMMHVLGAVAVGYLAGSAATLVTLYLAAFAGGKTPSTDP